jgi:hypothetical protein
MKRVLGLVALSLFGFTACAVEPGTEGTDGTADDEVSDIAPTAQGKAIMPVREAPSSNLSTASTTTIVNHGGPVMSNGVNVYYIWYGSWAGNSATTILTDLVKSIGGSSYYNINTTYGAPNSVTYKASVNDNYSNGTTAAKKKLTDANIYTIVTKAITGGGFGTTAADPNGLYFVLTSSDVTASSGFCTQYCGWHASSTMEGLAKIGGVNVKYSFIGNPEKCPSSCAALTAGPNGNVGADGMASIITHELEEAATDPDGNAWYDGAGAENADKCAWTFGTTYTAPNGTPANIHLGARDFYIQRNWLNVGAGSCAQSY